MIGSSGSTVRAAAAVVLAALAVCWLLTGAPPAAAAPGPPARVVVLGVDALTWSQVNLNPAGRTPLLAALARTSATGLLATRGARERTSVPDGWATLSAGARARAGQLPAPDRLTDAGVATAQRATKPFRTGARVGALSDAVGCADASGGRGAVLAGARSDGRRVATAGCPLRLIEAASVAAAEQALADIERSPQPDLLLVVGVGDSAPGDLHLHVAVLHRAAAPGMGGTGGTGGTGGRLESASTGRAPYVQLVDVAPTVLRALRLPIPPGMAGQPMVVRGTEQTGGATRAGYLDADRAARQMHRVIPVLVSGLAVALCLGAAAAAVLQRTGRSSTSRRLLLLGAGAAAAAPAASFLARLLPYERWGLPGTAVSLVVLDLAVVAACRGRASRIAALTLLLLAIDLGTGAHLQLHSVLGYSAIVAGRFAGIGNPASGVLLAATLLTAGAAAGRFKAPRLRQVAVLGIGALGLLADGWPGWGSDLGGVLALAPAVVLFAAHAGRVSAGGMRGRPRATVLTLAAALAAALGAAAILALVDLSRPAASRTHLARFAADLVHGRAGTTLARKAVADMDLLTSNAATLAVPVALAGMALVLRSAMRGGRPAGLGTALRARPLLGPTLTCCLVAAVVGMLVNDSGVVIPATMALLAVPVAVQAGAAHPAAAASAVPWASVGSPVGRARQTAEATDGAGARPEAHLRHRRRRLQPR